ncbi:MAG: nucleoside recognition domain-containing protein, partial [Bdellovibrionota bacterium]
GISIALWFLATYPKVDAPVGLDEKATAAYQLEHSFAGMAGHAIEPLIKPLGYDWKIGIGILSSFAAREVVLSTLGTVYAIGYEEENSDALAEVMKTQGGFTLATALSLLIFYALACQCMSTLAVAKRETNSYRWPIVMFVYMSVLAYAAAFAVYQITLLLI